ncbi:LAETG motif-containing sortase-dependent surface protein [Streptomyces sp. NPDC088341]|uniref:LAETG motif-containing sortase-dependent surface protein n=1 Tax=Streptomyces sp. NPDC088341 TaxID=3154870 RepID=UPI00343FF163
MKLRRAMAVAAATAVIAPAALFSAPAAFAHGDGTVTTTESPSASPSESTTSPAPEDSESGTPSAPPPATSGTPSSPAASESSTPASSPPATGTSVPATPGASPSDEPSEGPAGCLDENGEVIFGKDLRTAVSGLPEKIVAGSGFHALKLNVTNKSDEDLERVDFGVFASRLVDEEPGDGTGQETGRYLALQFKDPESGVWEDISLDEEDENYGYIGYTEVKAKQSYTIDLRLSVAKSAPAGPGVVFSIGLYSDSDGNCVIEDNDTFYEFEILGAGADPGEPNEAEPQEGGKKPLPKPTGDNEIKPQGSLAETGSSSMVPVIGMAGAIAIVAGAGVVFALRRRQGSAVA